MSNYSLYCVEIGELQLLEENKVKYVIHVDTFQRSFSIKDKKGKIICQTQIVGWFFWKQLKCDVVNHGTYLFKNNILNNPTLQIKYNHTWNSKSILSINDKYFDIYERDELQSLQWNKTLTELELILTTCLLTNQYVLKSPRRTFEDCSSKFYKREKQTP